MRWLRFLALAWLAAAAASGAARPHLHNDLADLADRARALPAEFAADALLRIAAAGGTDAVWRRQAVEDAFQLAAGAQQPFARHDWNGRLGSPFDKAYAQGLDACTLQCRAVDAMLELDFKKARELFSSLPSPRIAPLSCSDRLVYDVSVFYATAGELATRAFSAKEVAAEAPFHLLERYAADLSSPVQIAPIARMLAAASLKNGQFETLVDSFAAGLQQLSGDERSFAATVAGESDGTAIAALAAECTRRRVSAQPLLDAWRAYLVHNLKGARCADINVERLPAVLPPISADEAKPSSVDGQATPAGQCQSPECRQLAAQFSALLMGPDAHTLSAEQKSTAEWKAKLRQFLEAAADWRDSDDASECFQFKSHFYSELLHTAPNGPDRDLLLGALLNWAQNNAYQRDHRVEWFYPVNVLIVRAFSERALQESSDPVISLYAQLEQILPRPVTSLFGLL
jgi:hypothetical protein